MRFLLLEALLVPFTFSNETFLIIPTTSLDVNQDLCIERENGDPLPSGSHPSLIKPCSLHLHTEHTLKNEDPKSNRCFRYLLMSKELSFSFLTCSCSNFRNGTPMSYQKYQRFRCFNGAQNVLEVAEDTWSSTLKTAPNTNNTTPMFLDSLTHPHRHISHTVKVNSTCMGRALNKESFNVRHNLVPSMFFQVASISLASTS